MQKHAFIWKTMENIGKNLPNNHIQPSHDSSLPKETKTKMAKIKEWLQTNIFDLISNLFAKLFNKISLTGIHEPNLPAFNPFSKIPYQELAGNFSLDSHNNYIEVDHQLEDVLQKLLDATCETGEKLASHLIEHKTKQSIGTDLSHLMNNLKQSTSNDRANLIQTAKTLTKSFPKLHSAIECIESLDHIISDTRTLTSLHQEKQAISRPLIASTSNDTTTDTGLLSELKDVLHRLKQNIPTQALDTKIQALTISRNSTITRFLNTAIKMYPNMTIEHTSQLQPDDFQSQISVIRQAQQDLEQQAQDLEIAIHLINVSVNNPADLSNTVSLLLPMFSKGHANKFDLLEMEKRQIEAKAVDCLKNIVNQITTKLETLPGSQASVITATMAALKQLEPRVRISFNLMNQITDALQKN